MLTALYVLAFDLIAQAPPLLDPQQLAAHAALIGGLIASLVAFLKSPFGGVVWLRVPPAARLVILGLLGGAAAAFEVLALGKSIPEAILVGLTGLFGGVAAREMFRSVVPPKKKAPPVLVR
jgi:hypothetical protein